MEQNENAQLIDTDSQKLEQHTESNGANHSPEKHSKSPREHKKGSPSTKRQTTLNTMELATYAAISDFVTDVHEFLTEKRVSVQSIINYYTLLMQTTVSHKKSVRQHIDKFKHFIDINDKFIKSGKLSKVSPDNFKISYSENVFIDLRELLAVCDMSSKKTVMDHLRNIRSKLYPSKYPSGESITENTDLNSMFQLIEQNIDPNEQNPMNCVMKIIGSPIFPMLISQVQKSAQEGKLNSIIDSLNKMQ